LLNKFKGRLKNISKYKKVGIIASAFAVLIIVSVVAVFATNTVLNKEYSNLNTFDTKGIISQVVSFDIDYYRGFNLQESDNESLKAALNTKSWEPVEGITDCKEIGYFWAKNINLQITLLDNNDKKYVSVFDYKNEDAKNAKYYKISADTYRELNNSLNRLSEKEIYRNHVEEDLSKQPESFLKALKNKDIFLVANYIGNFNPYSVKQLETVNIKNYSYILSKEDENTKEYIVTLDVTKSQSPAFKIGKHEWKLVTSGSFGGNSFISNFTPIEQKLNKYFCNRELYNIYYNNSVPNKNYDEVAALCDIYSKSKFGFNNMEKIKIDDIHHIIHIIAYKKDFNYPITVDEFNKYINNTLGITDIDIKNTKFYNKETNMVEHLGHGILSYPTNLISSSYDKTTNRYTVIIEYYADWAYLFHAKTMQYILEKNPDGSPKLLSTKCIKDSGVSPGRYSD
jgi:hypothetical protein